jgi:putative transposase
MLEQDIRSICQWIDVEVLKPNIQNDHVHMIVSIPLRVSVSDFMGILKGKTTIKLFKSYPNMKKKPYWGNHFWARGYFVNKIGINEEMIRQYVKYQENKERQEKQDRTDFTILRGLCC